MQGKVANSFCCVRPPGHHAGRRGPALGAESNGFCILNNVACGCAYARVHYPEVERMLTFTLTLTLTLILTLTRPRGEEDRGR